MRLALLALALTFGGTASAQTGTLAAGGALDARLTAADDYLGGGQYVHQYALDVSGGPFEVRLTSEAFDPYLVLFSPSGARYDNDDWAGSASESRVVVGAGEAGVWVVGATTVQPGATGPFRLAHRPIDEAEAAALGRLVVADSLATRASALYEAGRVADAVPVAREALAVREAALGPDHPHVATALNGLAVVLGALGDPGSARPLLERALAIREAALGPDHPDVAVTLSDLALLLQEQGDPAAARPLLERALAVSEAGLGPDHPSVATVLDNLAVLLVDLGDVVAARPLHERALAIREAALGPAHPDVATSLNNLAEALRALGDLAAARPLHERALAIRQAALGTDHPDVAATVNNLAALLQDLGDAAAARSLLERALAVWEASQGPGVSGVAAVLSNLADLSYAEGDLDAARSLSERALAVLDGSVGPDHPDAATAARNLAVIRWAQEGPVAARPLLWRSAQTRDAVVEAVLPTLSVAEQRALVELDLGRLTGLLLSSHRDGAPLAEAYGLVGGWKGLLLRGLRRQTAIASLDADPAHAADVQRLHSLRDRVARAYRVGSPDLAELTRQKEGLERRLAAGLPDGVLTDPWRAAGRGRLGDALPPRAAFVDVYRYAHLERGAVAGERYAAVVTGATDGPGLVDLGPAEALDGAVARWRAAVLDGHAAEAETAALAGALWDPLSAALPAGTDRVWVSPDDRLARVPWAVLAEAQGFGAWVAEVASGRALARLLTEDAPASDDGVLLVGGVDFGPDGPFAPLPGTAAEVDALAPLAAAAGLDARVLEGAAPTPDAVTEAMRGVTYVHLATHGYVYAESPAVAEARSAVGLRTDEEAPLPAEVRRAYTRNPLAESGLALAGANGAGGQLTAEEMVGLDLAGTRLVVLSACDTGRGREVTGQGVLGLRASLDAAGAGAQLLSLWPVADAATAALMTAFYEGLWADGLSPAEALRRAQAAVRAEPAWAAPRFWAAWTLSGDAFAPLVD